MEHQSISISACELKFSTTDGEFSGYGSVFGNIDSKKDIIMPGAYDEVLKSGNQFPVYINHGWLRGELPVGSWSNLKQDERGLYGDARLIMQMPTAINAYWAMKSGLVDGLSVAIIPDHQKSERKADGTRIIHSIKAMKEISIVNDPANDSSRVMSVKFREEIDEIKSIRDFENFLRDAGGFSKSAAQVLTAKAKELSGLRDANDKTNVTEDHIARMLYAVRKHI